jgi:hypothetical protein
MVLPIRAGHLEIAVIEKPGGFPIHAAIDACKARPEQV